MNTNTSNTNKFRSFESQNSFQSGRRQVLSSSNYREIQQQGNSGPGYNTNRDGGIENQIVFRAVTFPDQISFQELVKSKDILQQLLRQFQTNKNGKVVFEPNKQEQYSKRLLRLQQQIDGLMRQSLIYNGKGTVDGQVRTFDYLALINQKQNQVNQLERKICNLEAQLRTRDQRQKDLQDELQKRFKLIKTKNDEIQRLRNSTKSYADAGKSQPEIANYIRSLISKLDDLAKRGGSAAQMESQVESWILGLPNESALKRKLRCADEDWLEGKYKRYASYLVGEAGGLLNQVAKTYTSQIDMLRSRGVQVDYDSRIIESVGKQIIPRNLIPSQQLLMSSQVTNSKVGASSASIKDVMTIGTWNKQTNYLMNGVTKVVEVPVQDARTKALIHKLATQMRRLYTKYPKLATEISPELSEYFSQEIIDLIEVDELDRLVEIVKYKPDIVKVENVYAYSSEKSRRVEFHLRVLIKALLEEMEKMKRKTGIQPQIDQGVIGMIRQEVMDLVDVDDILRVYRVVPKIVEVQKVVQQVVEKIVKVPHFITVQNTKTDIIPLNKIQVVKDTVNVPIQVPKYQTLIHEKLVTAPQYREKVVVSTALEQNKFETVTQIPKVRSVEKVVGLEQQVERIVQIPGPERIITLQKQIVKNIIEQKIVKVQKIVQQIVQVERIVQKPIEVIRQIIKIVEVEKIVQKIVPVTQYVENQRVQNFVVQKPIEVQVYIEKIVPVERIIERVVTHPQIIEKIVPMIQKQQIVKIVELIKQVPVYQTKIVEIQRRQQVAVPGPTIEKPINVDRIVQVPLIHEKVRVETEYRKEPIIEREHTLIREPVHVQVPVVLFQQRIVQVSKPQIHVVKQQYPHNIIRQKIVPYETVRQQLVPAPFIVEKVIEKLVQVPRIVEIEKIVEKIVPVPRIIQKIVEVEKIVQKIVERIIYQTQIRQVQRIVQVPLEVQKIQQIQVPNYIVERVQVPHYIDRDRIIVNQNKVETVRVEVVEQPPRVTIERKEVPIQLIVQKPVPYMVENQTFFQLQIERIVPVQIPIPTTLIEQKFVPVETIIPVVHQVDRIRDRIVEVKVEAPGRVQTRDRIVEKLFVQKDVKVVNNQIPYYNDRIVQVDKIVQKIVPVERVIQKLREAPYMIEKIVNQMVQIPVIHEVDRIVQVPFKDQKLVTVQRIVPKIITLNKAFAKVVDKLHEFPRLVEQMKKVNNQIQRIVPQRHSGTDIRQSEVVVEKIVIQQKMKEVQKFINVMNQSLKIAERIIERPTDPIIITQQQILEVPVIVQKLAERIIIMPQIVEILKYVHEITDNQNLGIALTGQIGIQEAEYQRLGKSVNNQLTKLRALLVDLRNNPQFKNYIVIIDGFLASFNKFLAYPRIRQIMTEKVVQSVVEKDKIVRVPTTSADDERRGLASAVLIDKLLMELKRLRTSNPNSSFRFDEELISIFGEQLEPISIRHGNNYNQLLDQYSKSIFSKFNMYGAWTTDHQRMLKQFIDERFELANKLKRAGKDSIKYKELYTSVTEKYNREKSENDGLRNKVMDVEKSVRDILTVIVDINVRRALEEKLNILQQAIFGYATGADTITYQLKEMSELDKQRVSRYLRQKDALIAELRRTIDHLKQGGEAFVGSSSVQGQLVYGNCNIHGQIIGSDAPAIIGMANNQMASNQKMIGSGEQRQLQAQLTRIRSQLTRSKQQISRLQIQIRRLREIQVQHRGCASRIRDLEQRLRTTVVESQKYQKELYQLRSVKQTKRTIGSVNTPQREAMSDSYGTNYMQYVDGDSSGVRNSKAEFYDKGVFRSGGNYGPIGSNEMTSFGNSGSVSGAVIRGGNSASGAIGSPSGAVVTTSGGLAGSTNYVQQRSTNYLSESRGSGISGVSGLSRGEISNKSSKIGGASYNYQQTYQREQSKKGSIAESSEFSQQKVIKNQSSDQSGSSRLYGTSVKQVVQKTYFREQHH